MGKYDFYYNDDQVAAMNDRARSKLAAPAEVPEPPKDCCASCGRKFQDAGGEARFAGRGTVGEKYDFRFVPLCERCF
jgi:hypothetical protein